MQTILIGRDIICNIVLNDNFVSRRHAEMIISDNGQVMIRDLGSSNGTFVNGNRISESYLLPGDIVKCASVFLNWQQYTGSLNVNPGHSHQSPHLIHTEVSSQPEIKYQSLPEPTAYKKENAINPINTSAFWGSVLVLAGFFLPWIRIWGSSINGAKIAGYIANSETGDSGYSVFFYLFPVSAAIFLISAFTGKVSAFASGVRFIPLIILIITVIIVISKIDNADTDRDYSSINIGPDIFQIIGIGFIMTVLGSVMMCFYPNRNT